MNSEYGQRLSLQELKQRNTQQAVLPTLTTPHEACPSKTDWERMMKYMDAEGKIDKIRILHKNNHVGNCKVGCDHDRRYSMSLPLESFLGDEGKVHFLSMIDPGPDFREDYREHIADKRLLLETFRRLQLPYYEEARLYWDKAKADGYFDGANEIWTYLPRTLKSLVEEYSSD